MWRVKTAAITSSHESLELRGAGLGQWPVALEWDCSALLCVDTGELGRMEEKGGKMVTILPRGG